MKRLAARLSPVSDYWRDVSWLALGTGTAQAINLLAMPVLTRVYAPEAFGAVTLFAQAVAIFALLISLRYEYAVLLPKANRDALGLALLVLTLAAIGTVAWTAIAVAAIPWIQRAMPEMPTSIWMLAPTGAAVASLVLVLQHLSQRAARFREIGQSEVVGKLAYFAAGLAAATVLPSIQGLIAAFLVAALAKGVWLSRSMRLGSPWSVFARRAQAWRAVARRGWRRHAEMSRSMLISHALLTATGAVPAFAMSQMYGAGTLGQWGLVVSTSYLPSALIGSAIGQVYFQRAAQAVATGQPIDSLWRTTVRKLAFIGFPTYILFALLSPWLYPALFGQDWEMAGQFAAIMALGAFLSFTTTPVDRTCVVVGAWRYLKLWHLARLATTLVVALLSHYFKWDAYLFVAALTLQMSLMYGIDFFAERSFAHRRTQERG